MNKTTVLEIEKTTDEKRRTELIKNSKAYIFSYTATTSCGFISIITKLLRTKLFDNDFGNKLDSKTDILAFQNGVVCLKTKTFRKGLLSSDYLTSTIPSDYYEGIIDLSRVQFVLDHFKKTLNNNDEHLLYFLCCIGACLIGKPQLIKSIFFLVDKTDNGRGDNGKTFIIDLLASLMPNYIYKTKATLIDVKNTKIHKQLVNTKGKRIVYMEELPRDKDTNAELLKDIGDGKKLENEIMYGTSEIIDITFCLFALTNHIPNIDPNEDAVYNRYRQISFNSHFDRHGVRDQEYPEQLLFTADVTLTETLLANYSHEIFHILIEYANKFYSNNSLPKIPAQFAQDTLDTKLNNDKFASWFNDNYNLDPEGKVALKLLMSSSGMSENKVREGMKRKGFKYLSDLRGIGSDPFGKHYKGGYEGIALISDDDIDDEDM
jgi:phage/plasmid-associated DNA primase